MFNLDVSISIRDLHQRKKANQLFFRFLPRSGGKVAKSGKRSINLDEGRYTLSHVYDKVLATEKERVKWTRIG